MRLVLCDDHRLFADSLGCILRSLGHEVVAWVPDPEAAIEILQRESVDACLVDLTFSGIPDLEGISAAVRAVPQTAFVLLTASADPAVLRRASACGVRGVALKRDEVAEIVATVTKALARRPPNPFEPNVTVLSSGVRSRFSHDEWTDHRLARFLTRREQEVLTRLVHGETTANLAQSMGVRMSTARTHIDAVLTKLGAHSRGEAVAYAVREGLVDITELELGSRAVGQ